MAVPYTFGSATSSIPLSQLDSNFATAITLGTTNVYLGNTTTTLNGLTLSNVTISSGNVTITSVTITNANITGTTTLSGLTASTALALDASKNIVSVTNTGTGNNVLAASPSLTGTVTIATLNLTNALGTGYGGTGLTSFTANGVLYASSSSALATSSALQFNSGNFASTGAAGSAGGEIDLSLTDSTSGRSITLIRTGATYSYGGMSGAEAALYTYGNNLNLVADGGSIKFNLGTAGAASEQMRLTSTGLGIGTSSPAFKLDLNGVGAVRAGNAIRYYRTDNAIYTQLYDSGSTGFTLDNANGDGFRFQSATTTQMRLDSSGNLGLGVTPSAWYTTGGTSRWLELAGGTSFGSFGGSLTAGNNWYASSAGTDIYKASGLASQYVQSSGQHIWKNAPSGTAGNAITFTQAMTLDASGNLGIGTTSPGAKLEIGGTNPEIRLGPVSATSGAYMSYNTAGNYFSLNAVTQGVGYRNIIFANDGGNVGIGTTSPATNLHISSSGNTELRVQAGGTAFLELVNGNSYRYDIQSNSADNSLRFVDQNASAERMRIDSSGNFILGGTTAYAKSTIVANASGGPLLSLRDTNGSATNYDVAVFNRNGTQVGSISTTNSVTLYNTTSDQRLKENIVDAPEFGGVIDSIQVRSFDWKTSQTHQRAGFVAQELVTVAPEAVHKPNNTDEMMAVDYSKLVPMLVKEIQSLRKRLADAGIA
jgi:hypothetical protein